MAASIPTIAMVKRKYEQAILRTQRLYLDRRKRDTAGSVRNQKGSIVEEITKSLSQ